jgi:hypothetical protein
MQAWHHIGALATCGLHKQHACRLAGSVPNSRTYTVKFKLCACSHQCNALEQLCCWWKHGSYVMPPLITILVTSLPQVTHLALFVSSHSCAPANCMTAAVVVHNELQGAHP